MKCTVGKVVLVCQVVLTGEPALVSLAAALLAEVVDHNPDALRRLPLTGLFFFALAYCGSNLVELSRLLHVRPASRNACRRLALALS